MTGFFVFLILGGLVVVGAIVVVQRARNGLRQYDWQTSGGPSYAGRPPQEHAGRYATLIAALSKIRSFDPAFSFVLFEDFLYALYAEAHTARGEGRLANLAPYLSDGARASLAQLAQGRVESVVIGGLRIEEVEARDAGSPIFLAAVFEANYGVVGGTSEQAYYTTERWLLSRPSGVESRPPARARVIDCPSCGAPLDKLVGRTCGYCSRVIDAGGYDWRVESIAVEALEPRPPMLTGTVEERGTEAPTVVSPDARPCFEALSSKDPALDWAKLSARVELIFRVFQEAWTKREPLIVRPYLSDNLFQAQLYWIDAYRRQGLANRTDGARITNLELARVLSDAHFDAVTLRIFATGHDYTVNEAGAVVGGDRDAERSYTEYWTLIRGARRAGAPRVDPTCPSCGAPLQVNMAGSCTYCQAKVTAGEFDWVLSRIEQDDVYG